MSPGASPSTSSAATLLSAVAAGLAGTAAMTVFQRAVEMPLTGRGESFAPANLATKLLPIKPRRRDRRRLNSVVHVGVGAMWGVGHATLAARTGLRGQAAVGAAFAALYCGDLLANVALGLYEPARWSARDWAIDVTNKLVLAETVGAVYDGLRA